MFLDLFSRKAISFSIGNNNSTNLVRNAFVSAIASRKPQQLTLHTDRGTPYTSFTMRKLARKNNVAQSFSYPGKPHDNAVMESFFASLKKEELYRVSYQSEVEFRKSIEKYLSFYNTARPHSHLDYKTPEKYESIFWNNLKS